ncbi:MAG: response regulator [Campylobacterales bacterium]|nr:response regulator [Campylobacterales bacterium]
MVDMVKLKECASKLTVLYAEDEIEVQQEIRSIFELLFKRVIVANNGLEGLELFGKNKDEIDFIVSDIRMPKMDGLEMVEHIRKDDSEIPIVMLTAFSE